MQSVIDFSENENFLFYFSIFNNFEDSYLIFLYETDNLHIFKSEYYYEIINFMKKEYIRVFDIICKYYFDENHNLEILLKFHELSKKLDIPNEKFMDEIFILEKKNI